MNPLIFLFFFLILISMAIAGKSFAPWVPTWKKDLPRIFKLADLKPDETFYDLGCGDGKTVIYAVKNFSVKAIGIELALPLYFVCKIRQVFVHNKNLIFKYKSLFSEDLSRANVIYVFGTPNPLKNKLKQKLEQELKPGARVISYVFPIVGWQPTIEDKPTARSNSIYLYQR
jgi:SAM-dependent methyltransferase